MKIPQPITLDGSDGALGEKAEMLPPALGVFCLQVNERVTYLGTAPNLQRRVGRTLEKLSRRSPGTQNNALAIHCWECGTKLFAALLLYELARVYFPDDYRQRLHLRMPWFVGLLTRDRFPRLVSANRIPSGCQPVIGPFARRDQAQLYQEQIASSFLLRRCTEVLQPHPGHPGCIYGEMRQCLRPCQAAVDDDRYLAEATAVSRTLLESGNRNLREIEKARDQAIEAMNFESAARIHKQLERFKVARAMRDPMVADVELLHGVVLVKVRDSMTVQLFPLVMSKWRDQLTLDLSEVGTEKGPDLEELVRAQLNPLTWEDGGPARDQLEDLALFARWYYSSWREGEWVPIDRLESIPHRKIARTLRKLVASRTETKHPATLQTG